MQNKIYPRTVELPKVLSAEMKLRANLESRESRGNHFREDIPFRDDDYLCYISLRKGDDGEMKTQRHPLPEPWTGDKSLPYEKRYLYFFPGEAEAKGFSPPPLNLGKGGRK